MLAVVLSIGVGSLFFEVFLCVCVCECVCLSLCARARARVCVCVCVCVCRMDYQDWLLVGFCLYAYYANENNISFQTPVLKNCKRFTQRKTNKTTQYEGWGDERGNKNNYTNVTLNLCI